MTAQLKFVCDGVGCCEEYEALLKEGFFKAHLDGWSGGDNTRFHYCPECTKLIEENVSDNKLIFFRCKCGEEIQGNDQTDEHLIICPKCKRQGQVEGLPF